jgi:hypothetical protein
VYEQRDALADINATLEDRNAELLAVLESIEACRAPFQQGERNGALMGQISLAMDMARAAIAKAKGE